MNKQTSQSPKKTRRWMEIALLLIFVIVLGTFAIGYYSKALLLRENPAPGRLVDVGGYKMHLLCSGSGSPTVILEAGLDDFSIFWSRVQPALAGFTQVCSYDRAGLGWSESSLNPRTSENMVEELHALLVNAVVEPPYVLVGHSFGGALVRLYTHDFPQEVAGLVLVDSVHEEWFIRVPYWRDAIQQKLSFYRILRPLNSLGFLALASQNIPNRGLSDQSLNQYRAVSAATQYYATGIRENEAFADNLSEIRNLHLAGVGNIPLIVLSRGYWDPIPGLTNDQNEAAWQTWQELQSALAQLSKDSNQVIATKSEHSIHLQQPDLVINAIRKIVEKTRLAQTLEIK